MLFSWPTTLFKIPAYSYIFNKLIPTLSIYQGSIYQYVHRTISVADPEPHYFWSAISWSAFNAEPNPQWPKILDPDPHWTNANKQYCVVVRTSRIFCLDPWWYPATWMNFCCSVMKRVEKYKFGWVQRWRNTWLNLDPPHPPPAPLAPSFEQ
jgi:hypothetical protein